MRTGHPGFNLLILILYFCAVLIVVAFVVVLLPLLTMVLFGLNVRGAADRLTILPGIEAGGGWKTAGVGALYGAGAWFFIMGAIGSGTPTGSEASGGLSPAASDEATIISETSPTPTVSPSRAPPLSPTATMGASPTQTTVASEPSVSTPTETITPSPTIITTANPTSSASATPSPTEPPSPTRSATVTRVVDGDTLEVRLANGSADTLRLIGVDTPEVYAENTPEEFEGVPHTPAGKDCLRRYGERASAFVTDRLEGEQITLQFDDQTDRRGFYGRLLVYVIHNGENLNHQLVASGYGRVYDSSFAQSDRFYSAESSAQRQQRRIWSCRDVTTPTPSPTPSPTSAPDDGDSGDGSGSLAVVEIHADAEGNDHENENDEYIVFENTGSESLDLSGWTVEDEADHTYTVPEGFSLGPGDEVTLYTGSGTNTATELYWGSDSAIWNNGGDTIIMSDESGGVVLRRTY